MKVKDAEAVVGRLSNPSKMPGKAWGIPASYCHRGSKLMRKEGTVCSRCYAARHRYAFPAVQAAYQERFVKWQEAFVGTRWVDAMSALIAKQCAKVPFFRWFDSGDLQSFEQLFEILDVCRQVPTVKFWMSTKERLLVKGAAVPANLVIRVSADMLDGPPPAGYSHTSTVKTGCSAAVWSALVKSASTADNYYCPAPLQDNHCGACRACWDRKVANVIYKAH